MATSTFGLNFPKAESGLRSTIDYQLKIIYQVLNDSPENESKMANFVKHNQKAFRNNYAHHYLELMAASLSCREKAIQVATAGLSKIKASLEFVSEDGEAVSLEQEMARNKKMLFATISVEGKDSKMDAETPRYYIRYQGQDLKEKFLVDRVNEWARKGVMERDAKEALLQLAVNDNFANEGKFDSIKDHCFILIGAGSAMGPFKTLMSLGATVVAIDVPRENVWKELQSIAEMSPGGKMYFPTVDGRPGCDLLKQPAEVLNWLKSLSFLHEKKLTIGNYTYLDGALHVLLSAAADAVIEGVVEEYKNVNVAFLCTPTDVSVVPSEAYYSSKEQLKSLNFGKIVEYFIRIVSFGTQLKPNEFHSINGFHVYNGLVVKQGPNYAFAKTIQLWRAIQHYSSTETGRVSLNVAPASATQSVVHNKTFQAVFQGMPYFKPIEIFSPETSNSLMAGLLLYDILKKDVEKDYAINPITIKSKQAVHGGAWRCAYSQNTIGFTSLLVRALGGPDMFVSTFLLFCLSPFVFLFLFEKWNQ